MEEIENTVTKIGTLAREVAAASTEHEEAMRLVNAADTALVERIVGLLKPALSALCSRVQTGERVVGLADPNRQRTTETHADWRGVYLSLTGQPVGPARDRPRHNDGSYEGTDLFLGADGVFRELDYSGSWSNWQGSSSAWTTTQRILTFAEVGEEYEGEEIAKALLKRLEEAHKGALGKRAEQLRAKAARISALVALL